MFLAAPLILLLVFASEPAGAHPLGNFTTNRWARLELGGSTLRVSYVLDEAELVAIREQPALEANPDAYARRRAAEIARNLSVRVNGRRLALDAASTRLLQPPGQGGLVTLRLEVTYEAALPASMERRRTVTFDDRNQPDRIGWREVIAVASGGSRIDDADVPEEDRSNALRNYPADPSVRPLDVRSAQVTYVAGVDGDDSPVESLGGVVGAGPGDRFVGLMTATTSSPVAVTAALLVAFGFGALHALGPGHGKTIMAAYLVSTRGRRRDALYLGGIVSLMHTASVLGLAVALAVLGRTVDAGRLYPSLSVVAGLLVVSVGAAQLRRVVRARSDRLHEFHEAGHDHEGEHGHHHHPHHHGPDGSHGGHRHRHDIPAGVAPLSRAGLVALGTSGGLFPSPSAVVVLVGAFAIGRAPFGLALIGAFSLGLAVVLTALGLVLVAGRQWISGSALALHARWLPVLGAFAVTGLGLVLMVRGVTELA